MNSAEASGPDAPFPEDGAAGPARKDVVRNRVRLLAAARTVLTAEGAEAPFSLIAAEAGVSRTTLHRHFADREALIAALLDGEVARVEHRAAELAGSTDGLEVLLHEMLDELAPAAWLQRIASPGSAGEPGPRAEAFAGLGTRLHAALDPLVDQARAAGAVHPEVTTREVQLALPMAVAASTGSPGAGTDPAARRMLHRALFTAAPTAPGSPARRDGRGPGEPAPPSPVR